MNNKSRRMRWVWTAVPVIAFVCISVVVARTSLLPAEKEKNVMPLIIISPSFTHGRMIPARHTCDGVNISPPLAWTAVPAGTKSLALIVDDPDAPNPEAPRMTWVHWVLYNIPPDTDGLPESTAAEGLPQGTLQGLNDWHDTGYQGPCPPIGKHRYFFKLYALDTLLPDLRHPTKAVLEKAMQDHVLARSELIGLYQRQ